MNATEIFTRIYDTSEWVGGGSGEGSQPQHTIPYRQLLQQFLADKQIKSVLDIGCGDWQSSKLIDWAGIDYTGVDCVLSVVSHNQSQYERFYFDRPSIVFRCFDVFTESLPLADLVILKDVIQHWSNRDILEFLPRLNGYKYVLITNCEGKDNPDGPIGVFRPINLHAKPFCLKTEVLLRYETKRVELWTPNRSQ